MRTPKDLTNLSKEELIKIILELEKRLTLYENAHTPSSQNKFPKRDNRGNGKLGAPLGHEGTTRESKPEETINYKLSSCPYCNSALKLRRIRKRIIEEISEPQPIKITQHNIHEYYCRKCKKKVVPYANIPEQGIFGKNILAHITLLKFDDRLPLRKIVSALNRQFNLKLTDSSVLAITNRVSNLLIQEYNKLIQGIRASSVVYADETGIKINGKLYYVWIFTTNNETLFVIRKSRSKKVIEEILGNKYLGIITCDGWTAYSNYTNLIQRCWAHLLREIKYLVERYEGAKLFYEQLNKMFKLICKARLYKRKANRERIHHKLILELRYMIGAMKPDKYLKKLACKIENGLEQWVTCLLYPEVEPTNNKAERALREIVVQRKIIGTLRNEKGSRIMETIHSLLATWKQQGLNTFQTLRSYL